MSRTTEFNRQFHDEFWQNCPDFSKYNPGVLHRRRRISHLLRSIQFDSLLDVGCGDGENLLWLRSILPTYVRFHGVDLSSETVEANRKRLPFASFDTLNLAQDALPCQFDAVLCTEVLEHIDDQPRAMANLAAMIAPRGHLVLTCPTGKIHATEKSFGHVHHPTPQQLRRLIEESGLRLVSLENWGWPLYTAMKYATNLNPTWALKNFATKAYDTRAKLISRVLYLGNFANLPSCPLGCQLFALAYKPS
ncbi:MAG: class I SAM-dependent methyltransferase [Myxococcales bacterium]|nr:class I SAM-dependent methyltransferase [Polyangiaceae bacterium]MDW8249431.1 class I SAM-dependent methyltransferase [Myxococcales bacterium]